MFTLLSLLFLLLAQYFAWSFLFIVSNKSKNINNIFWNSWFHVFLFGLLPNKKYPHIYLSLSTLQMDCINVKKCWMDQQNIAIIKRTKNELNILKEHLD